MSKMVRELPQLKNTNMPEPVLQSLSTCIVDKIYDKATPVTLNGLATGKTSAPFSASDKTLVKNSVLQCINQLKQQMGAAPETSDRAAKPWPPSNSGSSTHAGSQPHSHGRELWAEPSRRGSAHSLSVSPVVSTLADGAA